MSIQVVGLDFETSGTDCWGDPPAAPIQIGIYVQDPPDGTEAIRYGSLIGGWNWSEYEWNESSQAIHNFTKEQIAQAEPVWRVDIKAAAALLNRGIGTNRMFTVMVGWNVAGFDRQFIIRHMPALNRVLSYRTIDLNALCLALAEGDESKYIKYKIESKAHAEGAMASWPSHSHTLPAWHDALYDAEAAVWSYQYLSGIITGRRNEH